MKILPRFVKKLVTLLVDFDSFISMKRLLENLLYYPLVGLIYLVSLLPLRIHHAIADLGVFLLYNIFHYRKTVIITNLSRSFPEKKYPEIRRITKAFYRDFLDIFVEMIWSLTRSRAKINRHVSFENPEAIQTLFGTGKNLISVLGHFGNWEICCSMGPYSKIFGIDLDASENFFIYKKQKGIGDRLVRMLRSKKKVCTLIESAEVFRHLVKHRDGKGMYYFIADQSPRGGAKFGMNFLNQPTSMINGPEYLATRLGLPVFYTEIDRRKRGYYHFTFTVITPNATQEEPGFVTRRFAQLLEESIQRNPSAWLWSHKRWKRDITKEKLLHYFEE